MSAPRQKRTPKQYLEPVERITGSRETPARKKKPVAQKPPRIRRKLPPVIGWISYPSTPTFGFLPIAQPNGMAAFMAVTFDGLLVRSSLFPKLFWTLEECDKYQAEVFVGQQAMKNFQTEREIEDVRASMADGKNSPQETRGPV